MKTPLRNLNLTIEEESVDQGEEMGTLRESSPTILILTSHIKE